MAKTSIDAKRTDTFMVEPERLTFVTDKNRPNYDKRIDLPVPERMVRNVMVYGIIQPIVVTKNGDAIEVVTGRQRVKAALEANKRLDSEGKLPIRVPCIVRRGTEADLYGVTVSENEQRQDDTPLAKADKAQRLLNMGKTESEIADIFNVSRQTICNWLKLQTLAAPIRQAVERGEITATAAGELSALSGDDQKKRLEEMKSQGGKVTVTRARSVAKGGDSRPIVRLRSRKEITENLNAASDGSDFHKGFTAALRWVLRDENDNDQKE